MPICEELGIPPRLWSKNHPVKDGFVDGEESLYRWYHPDIEMMSDGTLSEAAIGKVFDPPIDISCNRSTLCKYSTDVLYNIEKPLHRFHFGIIETKVKIISEYTFPCKFEKDGKSQIVSIRLTLKHSPEKCMYPHTEIKCYKDGVVFENEEVKPKSLRKAIRLGIAPLFTVCHYPDPLFLPSEEAEQETVLTTIKRFFKRLIGIT